MSSAEKEKERLRQNYESQEQTSSAAGEPSRQMPDAPPAYDEIQHQQNPYDAPPPPEPNSHPPLQPQPRPQEPLTFGYPTLPQQQQTSFGYGAGYGPGYGKPMGDPTHDPNVYKIKPDKVDIRIAPPEHLNPQYVEFRRQQQAGGMINGDPKGPPDNGHGGGRKKKVIDSSFPGNVGARYHNGSNR
ncbi:uncharacterized protein LODBEIA_P04620 [Lodderomyces beijingensis]|uniref:Uncharacterized protein n=1 Tax=Lodderomyces beijingensis TaxID=1775926 RepID=A0ABP0ZDJ0_9ASCO